MNESSMKRVCDVYIRRVKLIGALYSIAPTVFFFGGMFAALPFRSVYVLRFILSLLFGGVLGAYVNQIGLRLWLGKHRSAEGPATVLDGIWVGVACGMGNALLPPLTSLIASHHIEEAKWFIICAWTAAMIIGGCFGAMWAAIARTHLPKAAEDKGGTES